ncbi:inorganic diphosphatase [Hydrogenibacillus sp. N12]|uniref:inorganic diphosphatase n=1 Tax=Hydrogenibacillus sp. N12 TaxID=2866627 RepID=UPI001C7DE43F|nr:inorganic diphosphatase [Hydrogenibacillus sp. N12]QZA34064.1 inorganic diphosphatase [Hydrogenibacillus sp. N12]
MSEGRIVDVLVEIPTGSANKYEYDKEKGRFVLDRVLYSPMFYPADYGFIEGTLAEDGDPLDALVLTTYPTFSGCIIPARVVGALLMRDDKGQDEKLIAVPAVDPRFAEIRTIDDLPAHKRKEIAHFFQVYKDLENKKTEIQGWIGPDEAERLLEAAVARYREQAKVGI